MNHCKTTKSHNSFSSFSIPQYLTPYCDLEVKEVANVEDRF